MDFKFNEQQEMFRRTVRKFAETELPPLVDIFDKEDRFPHEIRPKLAALNLYGVIFPEKYGGAGADHVSLAIVWEEVARILPAIGIHIQLAYVVGDEFNRLGSEEQKQKWLVPIIAGQKIGCFAFTEPETGSNPKMLQTTARTEKGGYVLNGIKRWITHAPFADVGLIFAKDDSGDISLFMVETDRKGWSTGKTWELMGLRGDMLSEVYLDNVWIPKENLLGAGGGKFLELKRAMTLGKLGLSSQCVGIMQGALEDSIKYAHNRMHLDQPITSLQSTRWLLAEMACRLEACRSLLYRAAWIKDQGGDIDQMIREVAICKLFVAHTAVDVVRMGMNVHGVYGYCKDYKIERLFRDVKSYELLEGSSEIQRELVATRVIKDYLTKSG